MYKTGDVIVYSAHGLCRIEDITDRTIQDVTRTYYVMHPLAHPDLTISCPVDSDKVLMLDSMDEDQAEHILRSFLKPGVSWVDDYRQRSAKYKENVKTGDRMIIAQTANTLMLKEIDQSKRNKHLYETDRRLLGDIQNVLFNELALSLNTTFEEIEKQVKDMIYDRTIA